MPLKTILSLSKEGGNEFFNKNIKGLEEVSIGHALISDALYFGIENTIQMLLNVDPHFLEFWLF